MSFACGSFHSTGLNFFKRLPSECTIFPNTKCNFSQSKRQLGSFFFYLSFLIHLCLSFGYLAWHTCFTSLCPEELIICRTSDDNCHGVGFLQLTQIVNIQMLNTHLFIIRTPDSVRESMSAGPLRSSRSFQVVWIWGIWGRGAVRCEDSFCSNFEMATVQNGNKNQNHKH